MPIFKGFHQVPKPSRITSSAAPHACRTPAACGATHNLDFWIKGFTTLTPEFKSMFRAGVCSPGTARQQPLAGGQRKVVGRAKERVLLSG